MSCLSFCQILEGGVLVAHNAYFDMGFWARNSRAGSAAPAKSGDRYAGLARRYISARRYNLTALVTSLGERAPTHRAMSDVRALRIVFAHLLDLLYRREVRTLNDLLRAQRGLLPGDEESRISQHINAAIVAGNLDDLYRTSGGRAS
jgi:DNA polymerase-3 subunit epsilon